MLKHPHILLITGDHVRPDVLEATDDGRRSAPLFPHIPTPHLDRLAAQGIAFSQCHALNPICVPSRASITSGCYPHKATGTKNNAGALRPEAPRLARHFRDHGYDTVAIGKLHYLPYMPPGEPRTLHGFEHAELCEEGRLLAAFAPRGRERGVEDYHDFLADHGWAGYERSHGIGNNDIHPGFVPFPAELHEEAWVTQRSIAAITRHVEHRSDSPLFLWSSFTKPHPPYDPPAPYDRLIDPRSLPSPMGYGREDLLENRDPELRARGERFGWNRLSYEMVQCARARYGGLLAFQDEMIGRILSHLEQTGLLEDTIIIYTADHGDLLGDFGRFFKSCMFDGSVKVPLVIRPNGGRCAGAQKREHLVGLHDLFPTLTALSSLPTPEGMDGVDLSPMLADPATPGRDYLVSQCLDHPLQKYMLRTAEWKYVYHESHATEELYHLTDTDYELTNLAAENPRLTEDFRARLAAWCHSEGDTMMLDPEGRLHRHTEASPPTQPTFNIDALGWRHY